MKITAEFNSNEELINFISTFGAKTLVQNVKSVQDIAKDSTSAKTQESVEKPVEIKKQESLNDVPKEETPKEETPKEETPKDEDSKITKETIRAIFTKLIKAGKQKEAKELTLKYGASKLPDLKEEHYAEVYKEAEALL